MDPTFTMTYLRFHSQGVGKCLVITLGFLQINKISVSRYAGLLTTFNICNAHIKYGDIK